MIINVETTEANNSLSSNSQNLSFFTRSFRTIKSTVKEHPYISLVAASLTVTTAAVVGGVYVGIIGLPSIYSAISGVSAAFLGSSKIVNDQDSQFIGATANDTNLLNITESVTSLSDTTNHSMTLSALKYTNLLLNGCVVLNSLINSALTLTILRQNRDNGIISILVWNLAIVTISISDGLFSVWGLDALKANDATQFAVLWTILPASLLFEMLDFVCTLLLRFLRGSSKQLEPKIPNMELQNISENEITLDMIIGEGTYATVYSGAWRGMKVAVKQMNEVFFAGDEDTRKHLFSVFKAEEELMAKMHNPNIVQVYGICVARTIAIVMELAVDGSLYDYLCNIRENEDGKTMMLTLPQQLRFALDVVRGVLYLHDCGIIHRDLKSKNILVCRDSGLRDWVLKISDFGSAKTSEYISGTRMSCIQGTAEYLAPEIFEKGSTYKTDIYSLAIILWEIFSCKEPYYELAGTDLGMMLINEVINKNLRPNIEDIRNSRLRQLIECCWSRDENERPGAKQIFDFLRSLPIEMEPVPASSCRDSGYSMAKLISDERTRLLSPVVLSPDSTELSTTRYFGV